MLTGKPPSVNAWLAQCCLYVLLMVIVKICITLLIQLDFWDDVRDFILSPIINPKVEVVVVMLVIPFFINVSIYVDTLMSVSHPVQCAGPCVCVLLHDWISVVSVLTPFVSTIASCTHQKLHSCSKQNLMIPGLIKYIEYTWGDVSWIDPTTCPSHSCTFCCTILPCGLLQSSSHSVRMNDDNDNLH